MTYNGHIDASIPVWYNGFLGLPYLTVMMATLMTPYLIGFHGYFEASILERYNGFMEDSIHAWYIGCTGVSIPVLYV